MPDALHPADVVRMAGGPLHFRPPAPEIPAWIETLLHREIVASFTILGQPQSKANSRQIVTINGRPSSVKSKDALAYEEAALRQIPPRFRLRLEGPLGIRLVVHYRTELPDLDESLVLDCLQDRYVKRKSKSGEAERVLVQSGVYRNDRQVRFRVVEHRIDRHNPRTEVELWRLAPAQAELPIQAPPPKPAADHNPLID